MNQLTREPKPQVAVAKMWIGLWAGEVVLAAEYWLARGASVALSTAGAWLRRPVYYGTVAVIAGSLAYGSVAGHAHAVDVKVRSARLEMHAIMDGLNRYQDENDHLPGRLEALVPKYVPEVHADPWGTPYAYYQGQGGAALVSAGPDGKLGGGDDIVFDKRGSK